MQAANSSLLSSRYSLMILPYVELFLGFDGIESALIVNEQSFSDLKTKLVQHGQQYAAEALTYRNKIAELAVDFIKDGSVVS